MRLARLGHAAVAGRDGLVYVFGGRSVTGAALRSVEVYDPRANRWQDGAPMPTGRVFLAAALASDGRIYAAGGAIGLHATRVVEAYAPTARTWRKAPPLPSRRLFHAATTGLDGRVYVIGGEAPGPDWITRTVVAYDASRRAWAAVPPMLAERIQPAAATAPDGTIYVVGGCICEREPLAERYVEGRR